MRVVLDRALLAETELAASAPRPPGATRWSLGRGYWESALLRDQLSRMEYIRESLFGIVGRSVLTGPDPVPGVDLTGLRSAYAENVSRSQSLENQIREMASVPGAVDLRREWKADLRRLRAFRRPRRKGRPVRRHGTRSRGSRGMRRPGPSWRPSRGIEHSEAQLLAAEGLSAGPVGPARSGHARRDGPAAHLSAEGLIRGFGALYYTLAALGVLRAIFQEDSHTLPGGSGCG